MISQNLIINIDLAKRLIAKQFPQWRNLAIEPIAISGWDNRVFHLGESMLVRMPSSEEYAGQVEKEHQWLPRLAPFLPLPIPEPIKIGEPAYEYPWKWSIYRWLEGESAATGYIADKRNFAISLAQFLNALQKIETTNGPLPGDHNFYRGGSLLTYDAETRQAITALKGQIDTNVATEVWESALETNWPHDPVWVHGDVSTGNLLVYGGQLSAVIDFGALAIGDPACDLAITWTLFKNESREAFRERLTLDAGTWARGRAWTLWKALIIASGLATTNAIEASQPWRVIEEVLTDHKRRRVF